MDKIDPNKLSDAEIIDYIELHLKRIENLEFEILGNKAFLRGLNEEKERRKHPPTETG